MFLLGGRLLTGSFLVIPMSVNAEANGFESEMKELRQFRAQYISWFLLIVPIVIFAYNINVFGLLTKGL